MEERHVFVARAGNAAYADLIDHVDVTLGFAAGAADIEGCGYAALEHMDDREALADIDVFQMRRVRPFARRSAVGEIVGCEKVGFRRIGKNVIARIDAGMEMGVDETRRDETAFGIYLFVYRRRILFADVFDPVAP